MEITFQTVLTPSAITITLDHEVEKISVTEDKLPLPENSFYLFFAQKECQAIGRTIEPKKWDKVILIQLSWEIEAPHMISSLLEKAQASGLTIMTDETLDRKIPTNIQKKLATPNEEILTILALFGYSLGEKQKTKKQKTAKAGGFPAGLCCFQIKMPSQWSISCWMICAVQPVKVFSRTWKDSFCQRTLMDFHRRAVRVPVRERQPSSA